MRRSLFSLFILLFLFSGLAEAQRDSSRNDFASAESWFLFEEYGEAEAIYQKLLKWDPDNDNLKYKIGVCLLNDPYRKQESLDYLLDASKNINPEHKDGSFKESTAPPDVLFYLGSAFLVNEMIDPSIESFRNFLKIMDPEVYDEELVQAQIKSCENAKRLMSMPVDLDLQAMGSSVNTRYSETNPVVSGNGERMAFITKQPFFDEALYIEKENGEWTLPMSVTSMLGFDMDIYPLAMNYEGTEMLLYYDDEHIGNLYISRYVDGFWASAEKLGENISTKYWESHACFSKDGQSLYFTSNRKGSLGGLDIYLSERSPDGKWGIPTNLGPEINTRYNEETPFITEDGNTLYFSSYGHYNMGGYDIFYSTRNDDGSWGEPVNLGYPINGTDDDLFFHPVKNGMGGYQSRISPNGANKQDIYYMDIYSANNPRMYVVTGFVRTQEGDIDLTTLEMFVIDPESGDTIKYNIPIQEDGSFTMNLIQGDYNLILTGEGFQDLITPLSITPLSNKEKIILEEVIELTPLKKEPLIFEGEESDIELKESSYVGTVGKALIIPVKAEKGTTLFVKVYQDSTLVSTDTIELDKKRVDLEIMPLPGTSVVELEMIDRKGNIHRNSLTIIGKEPVKLRDEPLNTEPEVAVATKAATAGTAAILLSQLQQDENSPMHATLLETELEKDGIDSPRKLYEHLYLQADQGDYSKSDVDLALAHTIAGEDTELLLKQLQENSEGPLAVYLAGLDLEKEGINSPEDLLRHLEEVAEANGFTMDDVREAMLKSVENYTGATPGQDDNSVELMKMVLLQKSTGPLHDLLGNLDTREAYIDNQKELFEYLYLQADENGYDKKEVDKLLSEILAHGDAALLYKQLLENSEGPLKAYLAELDLEKEGISSPEDLLRHLEEVAEANGFTMDDVREAMLKSVGNDKNVNSQSDMFEYLYLQADENGNDKKEVDKLLSETLAHGDAALLYQQLLENSEGPLKAYLAGLDLEKEGINSPEDLLRHLEEVAEANGFTMDDVRRAMIKALDKPLEVDRVYNKILAQSEGSMKEILMDINPGKDGIYTVDALIEAIYKALTEKGFSDKEIAALLGEMFPAHGELIKELTGKGQGGGFPVILGVGFGALILLFFLFFARRRKRKE